MTEKPLFSGLSLADPETGEFPVPKAPDFAFTTGVAADMHKAIETGRPMPKRASGVAPATKPSHRIESRRAPFALDNLADEKTDARLSSAFRKLEYVGFGEKRKPREFRPLTRAEGANNLTHSAEHVQERKSFPRMDRETGKPRVRTDPGTPVRDGRTSATAHVERVNKTGTRKRRAAGKARPRSADKTIFSGKVGMTATRKMTPAERTRLENATAERAAETLHARTVERDAEAADSRANAKRKLSDAIGREREATAHGDAETAKSAREDIRKFRKLTTFKGA